MKGLWNRLSMLLHPGKVRANLRENQVDIPLNKDVCVRIKGKNNIVVVDKDVSNTYRIKIRICGDNNEVRIGKSEFLALNLVMGFNDGRHIRNSSFIVGDGTTSSARTNCRMLEDHTRISVGRRCMLSWGIELTCSDDHTVLNENGEVVNKARSITIGDDVWLGHSVSVLKNTSIADGCVVGMHSVVTRQFDKPHCAIAGNPARVVKEGISWHRARPDLYPDMTNS